MGHRPRGLFSQWRCWGYFPHDHARSRAYRWGEDGLLGITDRECRLGFAVALWNGKDPILKERLFGLTNPEGNHGEDVKEYYFYLDATPTYSYVKALYKYPQAEFPYARLVAASREQRADRPEFELMDTGIFNDGRYFDVHVEYAKAAPTTSHPPEAGQSRPRAGPLHVLPTLWCATPGPGVAITTAAGRAGGWRLTGNRKSASRIPAWGTSSSKPRSIRSMASPPRCCSPKTRPTSAAVRLRQSHAVRQGRLSRLRHPAGDRGRQSRAFGTKAAVHYILEIPAGGEVTIPLRLRQTGTQPCTIAKRRRIAEKGARSPLGPPSAPISNDLRRSDREADEFYATKTPPSERRRAPCRGRPMPGFSGRASSTTTSSAVAEWRPDSTHATRQPLRPQRDWRHLFNRDVLSMPDKWEYPWFAAWDLAFHMLPWPGSIPHLPRSSWCCSCANGTCIPTDSSPPTSSPLATPIRPYMPGPAGASTRSPRPRRPRPAFLERAFQNNWSISPGGSTARTSPAKQVFAGGFLGLDNIGIFDRSKPLPSGDYLEQADGTAWMAFYCTTMLAMALELAKEDPVYEDIASKFFEHFIEIADAMNTLGGDGLWDNQDGFYYDKLQIDSKSIPVRVRSAVGWIPLFAVTILEEEVIEKLPGFPKRMDWFLANRQDLFHSISCSKPTPKAATPIAFWPSLARPFAARALPDCSTKRSSSRPTACARSPSTTRRIPTAGGIGAAMVDYEPGESSSGMFGGNSNWRGPIWFPINYLLIEALERYAHFYGDSFQVEFPTGSGQIDEPPRGCQ